MQKAIFLIPGTITLFIYQYPGGPYTTSKYYALIFCTVLILPSLSTLFLINSTSNKFLLIQAGTFILIIFSQLISSKLSDTTLLTGSWGRNTGIISYLCLILLLTYSSLYFQTCSPNWLLKSLLISGRIQPVSTMP